MIRGGCVSSRAAPLSWEVDMDRVAKESAPNSMKHRFEFDAIGRCVDQR
jgi:hypothetical protein